MDYRLLLHLTAPELVLMLAALGVLALDLTVWRARPAVARFAAAATVGALGCVAALWAVQLQVNAALPHGIFVLTAFTRLVEVVLIALAVLALALTSRAQFSRHAGEYVALLLFATIATLMLVSTHNLLVIFIALEFLSLSLYILTAFNKGDRRSAEAGLKYFLFGGLSAAFILFGMSLLYGFSNSLNLSAIAAAIATGPLDPLLAVALVMIVVGFGFKIAAAPFHFWAPDAYQGAPATSAAFIASSSKVAGFFVLAEVMMLGLAGAAGSGAWRAFHPGWVPILALAALASMLLGNLAALAQTSFRRLLAYSAIGHAGYMLLAIVAHNFVSLMALFYYVFTYALAAMGAFGVLAALESRGLDQISDLAGLSRSEPGLAFCLLIFLLSLAGIPPLAGFFGKFALFSAALEGANLGLLWLVIVAVATSAVSLYYYLKVLKQVYVVAPAETTPAADVALAHRVALWTMAGLIVVFGCAPELLLHTIFKALI